jgi:hypothetical protein
LTSWFGQRKLPSDSCNPSIEMFLHRVTMRKPREIQQKRPAVRNKQTVFRIADRDQTSEKSTVTVLGALTNLTAHALQHHRQPNPAQSTRRDLPAGLGLGVKRVGDWVDSHRGADHRSRWEVDCSRQDLRSCRPHRSSADQEFSDHGAGHHETHHARSEIWTMLTAISQ